MFYPFPCREHYTYANRPHLGAAAPAILLFSLLFLTACGGGSPPGSSPAATPTNSPGATPPTTSSTTPLTVSATLPAGEVGSAYKAAIAVSGGTAPYTFSTVSGELPSGVLLGDNTGTISGTPSAAGTFGFAVSVSDSKGSSAEKPLQITVANTATTTNSPSAPSGTSNGGNSFTALQHSAGWGQFGQQGPNYVDCSPSPCDGISFWMAQGVSSPSMSGQASEFNVGGTAGFSDALWNNHLMGPNSSQGLPDTDQSLVPSLHNFTYDVYFYGDNFGVSQAIEFDINQFFDNMGFIWGHQCRIISGNEWDVWDNEKGYWVHTGIPCYPNNNSWNHLTIKVQRTSDNHLTYQSITFNGVTSNLNWTFAHGSEPGWYGLTINFQMDGDNRQDSYNMYLDNLTFSYD